MATTDLNKVQYAGLDFDTHFDDLRAQLQVKFATDFNDFALSSLGIMLLDIVANGLDALSFYLDRRATDLYLATARTRKSVARITRQLGYKMRGAIASSVDLDVAVLNPQAFSITVPKGFQFKGPNDLVFEVAQDVTYAPGSDAEDIQEIACYQGQTFTETFVSDGTANQVFELRRVPEDDFVVAGTVVVSVNGTPFTESEFLTFDATNQFEVGYNDEPATIRFGDGVVGNIPILGGTISVTYVTSRGLTGQVSKDTIRDVVANLVVNFQSIQLSINNPSGSVGGDDPETIEHAKAFAGRVFKARQVAVTRSDYEALAGSYADPLFGRVAVAQAISSRSAASDLELQNQLIAILNATSAFKPAVTTQTTAGLAALTSLNTQLATIATLLVAVATQITTINTEAVTAITSARAVKNLAAEIGTDAQDIQAFVIDGKALVSGLSGTITQQNKDDVNAFFDRISAQATTILTASGSVETSAGTEIAAMGVVKDTSDAVGLTIASGNLFALDSARASALTQSGLATAAVTTISTLVVDNTTTVAAATSAINAHVDEMLSADCKANLVSVPILARDAAGFYAAPTVGLIQSLQSFLDARKEVTQTVVVTSGGNFLVKAVMTVRVGIRVGVSAQVVKTAVSAAVDGVLKNRSFGDSLYVSELMTAILGVEGVLFANVTLQGHLATDGITVDPGKLDASGNLVISSSEVITKGTVTVNTPEVVVS